MSFLSQMVCWTQALIACLLVVPVAAQTLPLRLMIDGEAPDIAADVLDTAVEHCLRGQQPQAYALFNAIREQLAPPPAILSFIEVMEHSGCTVVKSPAQPSPVDWRVGLGYDDNVTQGIRASSVLLGSAQAPVELWVDDTYKPIGSALAEASAAYLFDLGAKSSLQVNAGARQYISLSGYNLTSGGLTLKHRLSFSDHPTEWQVDWNELWLGGQHYQSVLGVTGESLEVDPQRWRYHGSVQQLTYHTQPQQNSVQAQLGLSRSWVLGRSQAVLFGGSVFWDEAQGNRAGGNRTGYVVRAFYQRRFQSWLFATKLELTRWTSKEAFMAGLIDDRRRNTLWLVGLRAEHPLSDLQTLTVDLQSRYSHDSVALYTYRASGLTVSWSNRF